MLIATVAKLGYLGEPDHTVLDTTYGRGLWWTRYRPANLVILDGDFRDMDYETESIPVVCYDPPTSRPATGTARRENFGGWGAGHPVAPVFLDSLADSITEW